MSAKQAAIDGTKCLNYYQMLFTSPIKHTAFRTCIQIITMCQYQQRAWWSVSDSSWVKLQKVPFYMWIIWHFTNKALRNKMAIWWIMCPIGTQDKWETHTYINMWCFVNSVVSSSKPYDRSMFNFCKTVRVYCSHFSKNVIINSFRFSNSFFKLIFWLFAVKLALGVSQ